VPMEASVALQRSIGIDTRLVSPVEMREIEPRLRADDLVAGCYEPASGYCNPVETAQGFVRAARAAGATGIWANLLYLKPGTREHFLECLARDWPELLPEYERLYSRGAYLPQADARPAKEEVRRLAKVHHVRDRRTVKPRPPERDEQLSLLSA